MQFILHAYYCIVFSLTLRHNKQQIGMPRARSYHLIELTIIIMILLLLLMMMMVLVLMVVKDILIEKVCKTFFSSLLLVSLYLSLSLSLGLCVCHIFITYKCIAKVFKLLFSISLRSTFWVAAINSHEPFSFKNKNAFPSFDNEQVLLILLLLFNSCR